MNSQDPTAHQPPNNSHYKNNHNILTQTPIKKQNSSSLYNPTPSTIARTSSPNLPEIQQQQNKQSQQQLVEMPFAYAWNSIHYRQSKYTGKILYTKYMPIPASSHRHASADPLPHINRTGMNSTHGLQQLKQYKHGPGILILDNNLWVIGSWSYDRVAGDRLYVITGDLGLLQLRIKQRQSTTLKQSRNTGNDEIQVEEICYMGTTLKNTTHNNKYIILGSQSANTWKWVCNLSPVSRIGQRDEYYYVESKQNQPKKRRNNQLVNHVVDWRVVRSGEESSREGFSFGDMYKFGSYSHFMANITDILINTQKQESPSDEGFKIQQQVSTTTTNIQTPLLSPTITNNLSKTQTLIYSDFSIGQTIQIRLKSQHNLTQTDNKVQTPFDITQLGVYRKDIRSRQQMPTGTPEYLYQIKQVMQQVGKDGSPMLPLIEVHECISNDVQHRYRYSFAYNISNSLDNPSSLYTDATQQYHLVQKDKSKLHLRALNFMSKSHTKLAQNINSILVSVQTIYYHIKQIEHTRNLGAQLRSDRQRPSTSPYAHKLNDRNYSLQQNEHKFSRNRASLPEVNVKDLKKQLQRIHLKAKYTKLKKQTGKYGQNDNKLNKNFTPTYNKIYHNLSHNHLPGSHPTTNKKLPYSYLKNQINSQKESPAKQEKSSTHNLNKTMQVFPQEEDEKTINSQLLNLTRQYGSIHKQLVEQSIKNKIPLHYLEVKPGKNIKAKDKLNQKDMEKSYYDRMVRNYAKLRQEMGSKLIEENPNVKKSFYAGSYKKYL